jgi:hypothetical protein
MRTRLTVLLGMAAALLLALPALAITNGVADDGEHPHVGQLFFYVPDAIDPRFDDPGAWYNCSGTLISPTVVLTAGHCTFGVGLDGTPTTASGGGGGNDVWISFSEVPDYAGLPLSVNYIPDRNAQRYADRVAWLDGDDDWHRGTAYPHPEYDDSAFYLHDAGVVVLDEPVAVGEVGELPALGYLDQFKTAGRNEQRFTPVGYGLEYSRPKADLGGDTRRRSTAMLLNLNGTFGIPDGVSVAFSNNNGKTHQGGTCSGDSGGPFFVEGTNLIVAVNSYGIGPNCTGTDGAYRIDQADDLTWLAGFLD